MSNGDVLTAMLADDIQGIHSILDEVHIRFEDLATPPARAVPLTGIDNITLLLSYHVILENLLCELTDDMQAFRGPRLDAAERSCLWARPVFVRMLPTA